MLIDPKRGGQSRISADDYVELAPELVAEVAPGVDLDVKFEVYSRCKVREYLVWHVLDRRVDWYTHDGSEFQKTPADANGVLRSIAFPGLWLDATALLRDDMTQVMVVAQRGMASSEHDNFVERLRSNPRKA